MKYTSNSIEETQKIAEAFINSIDQKDKAVVVGLYGDLGAGKTTFTQSVAKVLGVSENITSPTFVIEKIYELKNKKFKHLIHIDAYRIESSQELLSLGWQKIIEDRDNIILIEWPEKVLDIMPEHSKIHLKTMDLGEGREIEVMV